MWLMTKTKCAKKERENELLKKIQFQAPNKNWDSQFLPYLYETWSK